MRRPACPALVPLILLIGSIQTASAATREVCSSGCTYATIQAAVDAATAGDTIMVLDAFHTEGGIVVDKDLLIAGDQLAPPIIQAASAPGVAVDRVLEILPNADLILQDVVIRHGRPAVGGGGGILNAGDLELVRVHIQSNDANGDYGGGIRSTGPLRVRASVVSGNTADLRGGGIACEGLCSLSMNGTNVEGNLVQTVSLGLKGGGGIYVEGPGQLESCDITGNVSVGGYDGSGGGILSTTGHLVLVDTHVDGNRAGSAAGIRSTAPLTVVRGSVSDNVATHPTYAGGGLVLSGDPSILESTVIVGNSADGGAGITTGSPDLRIRRTVIRDNVAGPYGGGGIRVPSGVVVVEDSLVVGNTAPVGGGALIALFGEMQVRSSTVTGNTADLDGGGFYVEHNATLALSSVTVTDNTADPTGVSGTDGGGVYAEVSGMDHGSVVVRNSIIAGNYDPGPLIIATAPDCAGPITVDGFVSLGTTGFAGLDPACIVSGTGLDVGGTQDLLPLADNGGATMTHALGAGSLNLDSGDPSGCTNESGMVLDHDQRGGARVGTCDRGAYESQADLPIFTDDFDIGGTWMWSQTAP